MPSATALTSPALPSGAPAAARLVFGMLARLEHGTLDVQLPDGSMRHFGQPAAAGAAGVHATLRLRSWDALSAALRSGDIGFAEAYIAGQWTSGDLSALLTLLARNRDAIDSALFGSWWGRLAYRLRHLFNRNSRSGSRRNIHAHYDLGNSFYREWLDETMSYSSAWFNGQHAQPLADAQWAKVDRALAQCQVQPGQRVLEIGCGWGGVAERAAAQHGVHVTGVTLSTEQLAWAQERLAKAGLAQQADLRLQDYRDIPDGPFDAIVSIEMFEAVGHAYWRTFFDTVKRQLKPGGAACIQSITIRDDLFERYLRGTDFIQQYVFPGGLLPSRQAFRAEAQRAGLVVSEELAFGPDYAETLRRWRQRFHQREQTVLQLGFDTRFMRTWEFYLAYCEAGFDSGNTDVVQFTLRHA